MNHHSSEEENEFPTIFDLERNRARRAGIDERDRADIDIEIKPWSLYDSTMKELIERKNAEKMESIERKKRYHAERQKARIKLRDGASKA